jgi:hypothetical protein
MRTKPEHDPDFYKRPDATARKSITELEARLRLTQGVIENLFLMDDLAQRITAATTAVRELVFDMSEEEARQVLVDAAKAAGIPPHLIYAMRETGIIISEERRYRFSAQQRCAWDDAVAEYPQLVGAGLEHVPPSDLYDARTAQLRRGQGRPWPIKEDEEEGDETEQV